MKMRKMSKKDHRYLFKYRSYIFLCNILAQHKPKLTLETFLVMSCLQLQHLSHDTGESGDFCIEEWYAKVLVRNIHPDVVAIDECEMLHADFHCSKVEQQEITLEQL